MFIGIARVAFGMQLLANVRNLLATHGEQASRAGEVGNDVIGADVTGIAVGDEVVAIAPHSFGSHVTTPALFVALKPAGLDFEEAAAIPLAYMTAVYALRHLG